MKFKLTAEHIKLLQRMCIGWEDIEYGAPAVDGKRPYGNSDVEEDICEILNKKKVSAGGEEVYLTKDLNYAAKIHKETQIALQIVLTTKSFVEGTYKKTDKYDDTSWELIK